MTSDELLQHVRDHRWHHRPTVETVTVAERPDGRAVRVPTFVNEFWTSRQRAAHSLHEISYRACFKPQLPRFFIDRLTEPGAVVYDPVRRPRHDAARSGAGGPGAGGLRHQPAQRHPARAAAEPAGHRRRARSAWSPSISTARFERRTISRCSFIRRRSNQIAALRAYLLGRGQSAALDGVDRWIRMVAVNRLTGHSPGFLSVYTLPPNQATSVASQRKINEARGQVPPRRDLRAIVLKKSRALLKGIDAWRHAPPGAGGAAGDAADEGGGRYARNPRRRPWTSSSRRRRS